MKNERIYLDKGKKAKLKFIKALYGSEAFDNNETLKYGNRTLVGWCLVAIDTIEELEDKFSDEDIYVLFEQSQV